MKTEKRKKKKREKKQTNKQNNEENNTIVEGELKVIKRKRRRRNECLLFVAPVSMECSDGLGSDSMTWLTIGFVAGCW